MKRKGLILKTTALLTATASSAFAGETVRVYSSSSLVLAFVGFLALIVVIQLIPAIMTLIGAFKELAGKRSEGSLAKARAGE